MVSSAISCARHYFGSNCVRWWSLLCELQNCATRKNMTPAPAHAPALRTVLSGRPACFTLQGLVVLIVVEVQSNTVRSCPRPKLEACRLKNQHTVCRHSYMYPNLHCHRCLAIRAFLLRGVGLGGSWLRASCDPSYLRQVIFSSCACRPVLHCDLNVSRVKKAGSFMLASRQVSTHAAGIWRDSRPPELVC